MYHTILYYTILYYRWRALRSIFDDNCTLLEGASWLKLSYTLRAIKSVKTVVKFGLQEAQMCDNFGLLHVPSKNGAPKSQPAMRGR